MMRITVKKAIKIFVITELLILLSALYSKTFFANIELAFLSSFFIIVGSSFAYKRVILKDVEDGNYEDERDLLDTIEDPYELYDDQEINNADADELDLKAIVKEEKEKIKTFSIASVKHGVKGSLSLYRLLPYIFLILGFIALKNNNILEISLYLPSILLGIIVGSICSKEFF